MFVVLVTSHEAGRRPDGQVMTREGEKFWAMKDYEGWVEADSERFHGFDHIPSRVLTFKTRGSAEAFAKRWKGHPWWVVPKAYQIMEVKPRMIEVQEGWVRVHPPAD